MSGRDLTGADLTRANFLRADLRGTNFTNANLRGVIAGAAKVNVETRLRGAIVDDTTHLGGLVETQQASAKSIADAKRYFILGGVNPGYPFRFRSPAIPQGVFIDECRTGRAETIRQSVNGQDVDVKALPPGKAYTLTCTFFTADRPISKGRTLVGLDVNDNLPAGPAHS